MSDVKMSALHLIAGIINAPRFHREIDHSPKELTERCVHLLTNLGQNRDFAIKANYEMFEFMTQCILPFDDAGYMRISRYFVRELLAVVGAQHKMWGAVSYVMLSTAQSIEEKEQFEIWHRLNARFFEVLLDSGVISQEDERRLKSKSQDQASVASSSNSLDLLLATDSANHSTENKAHPIPDHNIDTSSNKT